MGLCSQQLMSRDRDTLPEASSLLSRNFAVRTSVAYSSNTFEELFEDT
jgi:hypothetical protein